MSPKMAAPRKIATCCCKRRRRRRWATVTKLTRFQNAKDPDNWLCKWVSTANRNDSTTNSVVVLLLLVAAVVVEVVYWSWVSRSGTGNSTVDDVGGETDGSIVVTTGVAVAVVGLDNGVGGGVVVEGAAIDETVGWAVVGCAVVGARVVGWEVMGEGVMGNMDGIVVVVGFLDGTRVGNRVVGDGVALGDGLADGAKVEGDVVGERVLDILAGVAVGVDEGPAVGERVTTTLSFINRRRCPIEWSLLSLLLVVVVNG